MQLTYYILLELTKIYKLLLITNKKLFYFLILIKIKNIFIVSKI